MTQQPYFYDGAMPLYYTETFQPANASYNEDDFHGIGGHPWLSGNEEMAQPFPPFNDEPRFPDEQTCDSLHNPPALVRQQANGNSPSSYPPSVYDLPLNYGEPEITLQYSEYQYQDIQPIEYVPTAQTVPVVTLPPMKPEAAIQTFEWKNEDIGIIVEDKANPAKKRKTRNIAPAPLGQDVAKEGTGIKRVKSQGGANKSLEEFMGLFDTSLTATKEKRRRKVFSAQEKKAVKSVRNVGACIQCKFRKKTCSAGRPCPYCARIAGSATLGAQLCHRESPFIDKTLADYYPSTSRKRLVDFHLFAQDIKGSREQLFIDGAGPVTYPFRIKFIRCNLTDIGPEDVANIYRTAKAENGKSLSKFVNVLEPGTLSKSNLDKWAFEYTHRFAKTKLHVANGFLFGVEYAARALPYSDLVTKVTRLVSLNFVLRAGITVLPDSDTNLDSSFRTIQAQIDTLLFQSLQITEKSLYADLQRLIFRSAGSLTRDAVVPVCLCVWQLARLQCMLASHLSNLAEYDHKRSKKAAEAVEAIQKAQKAQKAQTAATTSSAPHQASSSSLHPPSNNPPASSSPNPNPTLSPTVTHNQNTMYTHRTTTAASLTHTFNLLLCTFTALFRSSTPLLLDWSDPFSRSLLGDDDGLSVLATKMGRTLRGYRARGHSRKFKLGFGYREEMAARIRGLLRG